MAMEKKTKLVYAIAVINIIFLIHMAVSGAAQNEYKLLYSWGNRGGGDGEFNWPRGIAVDEKEQVYVTDAAIYRPEQSDRPKANRVQKFTSEGKFLAKWKTASLAEAIALDPSGNIYVAESSFGASGLIEKFTPQGNLIKKWEYEGREYTNNRGQLIKCWAPGGIAIFGDFVYLGNNSSRSIQKFTTDGKIVKSWGGLRTCCGFLDVTMDKQGNVYVAELAAHCVQVFDGDGKFLRKWGREGSGNGAFSGCCNPVHIAYGADNKIFTAEKQNPRIQVFTPDGKYVCTFGEGIFSKACGTMDIAVGPSGKLYVIDDAACRIHVFGKK